MRYNLTEKFIRSKRAAPKGKRLLFLDALVPGLALRVTDRGHKSFVLVKRFPGTSYPARRTLGDCFVPTSEDRAVPQGEPVEHGAITLAEARQKARRWLDQIARGIDPKGELERERAANQSAHTFGSAVEGWLAREKKWTKRGEAGRVFAAEFLPKWGKRPIADIRTAEIRDAIRAIRDRGAPSQARNALSYLRSMLNWAIRADEYGLTANAASKVSAVDVVGTREFRSRMLSHDEIRAVWNAATEIGYPYGDIVKMLILQGQRLMETARLSWREIDLDGALIVVPGERMKQGIEHSIPIAPEAMKLLRSLPRFAGDYVFSVSGGRSPFNSFTRAKQRLDKLSNVENFVLHDLRRTARSEWSALPGHTDTARELLIAHRQGGILKVYNRYDCATEKMELLKAWERRLAGLLRPAPASVVDIEAERGRRAGG